MQTLNHSHRRSKKSGKLCYIIKRKKPVESVRVITNRINLSENALPYCCVQSSFCADNEYLLKPCKNFELRELGSNVVFLSPFKAPFTTYHLLSDVARKTPLDAYNFIKVVYIHENENTLERNAFVSKCSVDEVPENIWKAISSEILTDIIFGILLISLLSTLAILIIINLQSIPVVSNANRLLILYSLFLLSFGLSFKDNYVESEIFVLGLILIVWRRFPLS